MSQKILIRTPNHLGDCVMALPMINETREAYPGSSVTVLTPEYLADLFEQNPAIDSILKISREHVHGLIGVVKIKEQISAHDFDIGFIMPPSFGAASAFKLAGVRERVGYIADGRRLLLSRPLPLPTPLNAHHRSELYFDLLRRASGMDLAYVTPKLFVNEADVKQAIELLRGFGIEPEHRYAVIAFRAVAESRRWGLINYAALSRVLVERFHTRIVLIGSKDDLSEGDELMDAAGCDGIVNLAGKTSLRETATITSRAALFIGNDSGPAHLAAAVATPLIVLSGADDPAETSPIASNKTVLYRDKLGCISCVKNKCPLNGEQHMLCMKEITLEMALEAATGILGENGNPADSPD